MIFIDPTEARENTRLPQSVINASQLLPGLERLVGADFLISPLQEPCVKSLSDPLTIPERLALVKHVSAGLLVQRKSGRDFTSSIPKLDEILYRMSQWTSRPWLLVIGYLNCDREGQCVIDDWRSGYAWNAVQGALNYWQLRGGMVSVLRRDSLVASWVNLWQTTLKDLHEHPIHQISHRHASQVLLASDWKDTLTTFPGIGVDRARVLADGNGTLADSLIYLSDVNSLDVCKLDGVGTKTIEAARQWMGLKDGCVLVKNYLEEPKE